MLVKVFGIADLLAALTLILATILPQSWVFVVAFYLLIKGGIFLLSGDWMSGIDVVVAIYLVLAAYGITQVIVTALAVLFLVQKGAFSLLS